MEEEEEAAAAAPSKATAAMAARAPVASCRRMTTVAAAPGLRLRFADGKGGPAGRELRTPPPKAFDKPKEKTTAPPKEAAAKLLYIGKETHYSIEACCDESQSE